MGISQVGHVTVIIATSPGGMIFFVDFGLDALAIPCVLTF